MALGFLPIVGFNFTLYAEMQSKSVFYIQRNKNRNEVHYALRLNPEACVPVGKHPLFAYWRNLEISPTAIEPIGRFESIAYGIASQELKGNDLFVKLRAFPERIIRIHFEKNPRCTATAHVTINGRESELKFIYVFAKEGLIKPTVIYVDINGQLNGVKVSERILR
ncbi:MAG TPA: DUF4833 domain-containing protein [Turneriella sp.]|nr:DUF4833 domain-containing protein [Turneriella sp.]